MDDQDSMAELRRELRALETENTELRSRVPERTLRHEAESLVFEVRRLRTQVARCHTLMRQYQEQIRSLTDDFWRRHPPRTP